MDASNDRITHLLFVSCTLCSSKIESMYSRELLDEIARDDIKIRGERRYFFLIESVLLFKLD